MTQPTLKSTRFESAVREETSPAAFADIVCGVDGSRGSHLAPCSVLLVPGEVTAA